MTTPLLCYRDEIPLPDTMKRTPQRPLGALSDFVVEQLPRAAQEPDALPSPSQLEMYCDEAREKISHMCSDDEHVLPLYGIHYRLPAHRRVLPHLALLDSSMLEGTYIRHGRKVPYILTDISQRSADRAKSITALTYQGLIHTNPHETDPRTFSSGETGRSEILFYTIHKRVEKHLARALNAAEKCLASNELQPAADHVHRGIDAIENGFSSYHRELSPEEFAKFRGFFTNAHRQLPGPSALFSAGMCALDSFLAQSATGIRQLNNCKRQFLLKFFPTTSRKRDEFCGQEDITQYTNNHNHNGLLLEMHRPVEPRREIAKHMRHARDMHLGIAKRYLPEAFKADSAQGTAGTHSLQSFLTIAREAYASLEQMIPLLSSLAQHAKTF